MLWGAQSYTGACCLPNVCAAGTWFAWACYGVNWCLSIAGFPGFGSRHAGSQANKQRGRSSEERGRRWLSRQGKDYDKSIVHEQLGLKERERGQQLAHGAHRWSLWIGNGETWSSISDRLVDDSQALSIPYTYSKSWRWLSMWCRLQVMFTDAGKQEMEVITSSP